MRTMLGFKPLEESTIQTLVEKGSIGNYLLYDSKQCVLYVGRSDTDLQKRLLDHVNEPPYKSFKFSYADSPEEAYYKECKQYHEYEKSGKLRNEKHPDCPDGMGHLRCPVCYFDL